MAKSRNQTKEEWATYMRNYYKTHPESYKQLLSRQRKLYKIDSEVKARKIEVATNWNATNPIRRHKTQKRWRDTHQEQVNEIARNWRKLGTIAYKQGVKKSHSKRRSLPTTTILGIPFSDSHLHHMTPEIAVYIPKGLHKSIIHNIWTGKGMKEINFRAHEWMSLGRTV